MKQRRLHRSVGWIICLVLLGLLTGWGCTQNFFTLSQEPPPQTPPQQTVSQKLSSFRFGVIYHTYADVYAQPDVNSERLTQCMYGEVVRIDQEDTWWYSVKVGPYPELSGWIHKSALTVLAANALYIKERNLKTIIIRQDSSRVFVWPSNAFEIMMGTELPFMGESEKWYLVRLPTNDIGRIAREAVYPSVMAQPLIQSKQPVAQPKQPMTPSKQPVAQPKQPVVPSKQPLVLDFLENSPQRQEIITTAQRFLGKVYIWGGTTSHGVDCSGLSYLVYKLNGIELPRVSWLQFHDGIGKKIEKSELQQGDLVFFHTYRRGPSHVGIYIGNNQFIHASPSAGVTTNNLNDPYFKKRYVGAKTLLSPS